MEKKDRHLIMLMVLIGVLMAVVDGSVVSIALPTITAYFHVNMAQSQWVMTGYLVTLTSLLLIFGKVSERTGKSKLFLSGFSLFTLSSLACGLATSLEMLILFRVVQALGAAMVFSISAAIIFQVSPPEERGRSMGYIGATVAVGSIIGPTLGGVITDNLGWDYIFLINVPIGVALLVMAAKHMKLQEEKKSLKMDWPGSLSLVTSMVLLMAVLGQISDSAAVNRESIILGLAFLTSLAAFLALERRCKSPLLDLSIFKVKGFALPNLSMIIFFISNLMISVAGPFYFERVLRYTPSQVGMVYMIVPFIMVVGSPASGWLYDRHHWKHFAALGMMILAASMFFMSYTARIGDPKLMILSFLPIGIGCALFQSPNNAEAMSALPRDKMSTASSVTATVRNLGMALGVSISSVLISMQLAAAGYHGTILGADPELLSIAISNVIMASGALCVMGMLASLLRNLDINMSRD